MIRHIIVRIGGVFLPRFTVEQRDFPLRRLSTLGYSKVGNVERPGVVLVEEKDIVHSPLSLDVGARAGDELLLLLNWLMVRHVLPLRPCCVSLTMNNAWRVVVNLYRVLMATVLVLE